MFDNAASWVLEFSNQIPGRFQIDNVVVRQFLALKLLCSRQPMRRLAAPFIEGGALVRIFAVPQIRDFHEVHEDVWRQMALLTHLRKVLRNLTIVSCRAHKGFN